MSAPGVKLLSSTLVIRNAFTRLPFRFGAVTMEAAATGILQLEVEFADKSRSTGVASDILAYKWFDKDPAKTPADNVADLLRALRVARDIYQQMPAATPYDLWNVAHKEIERAVLALGLNRLIASFASSMLERAVIDAVGRHLGLSFDQMLRKNALGLRPETIFPAIRFTDILAALPDRPATQIALRHTVGMLDPLTDAQLDGDSPDDGLPVSLESYIRTDELGYLKIKLGGDQPADIARLGEIADVVKALGRPIQVTLDGNEQYQSIDDFAAVIDDIRAIPALDALYQSILFIEQPLHRDVAMNAPISTAAKAAIGRPLLIDEADGWTTAFSDAINLGYEGVSHKNCKGVYRSLLNAALADQRNKADGHVHYFQSAEDLTDLAVVPLQADLAMIASLGIPHVERNGHHYFVGLVHLPAAEQAGALLHHGDLYENVGGLARLRIARGNLEIGSLQVPGFGVVDHPDLTDAIAEADWRFSMLETKP
ncbi:mandelate racemase [Devosia rhodophyticola]|uniref:Mandelate racemase n=1 Tax=Devosia rhodophyticola TaxID=3026423 RepID=A0ABY7YXU0_9HYPH|nr:mandelate racemase [Devosia rhodophyticola]WDR06171.1 mandelate racemase [Devosia rhodophyticola]